jgi:uncharacterized protein YbaR (Trm112 family)
MFVELIESLRCPNEHEEAVLVASAVRTEARHILEGMLGCPVCGAEFPISDGEARFGLPPALPPATPPSVETAMRVAAFLELTDARAFALLCGGWGAHADQIRRLADTPLVLVNPPAGAAAAIGGSVAAVIRSSDVLPFAAATARGVALDRGMSPALIEAAVRATRAGGRVVGPNEIDLPANVAELVRDDRDWVGVKEESSERAPRLIPLTRASR